MDDAGHEGDSPSTLTVCSSRLGVMSVCVCPCMCGCVVALPLVPRRVCSDGSLGGRGRDWPQWLAIGRNDSTTDSATRKQSQQQFVDELLGRAAASLVGAEAGGSRLEVVSSL